MDIIINNGAEAEVASRPTEVIEFVGRDGIDGTSPNLLDYVKRNELGDLAFEDLIQIGKLGTTIIEGGYIKTNLIDANAIRIQGNLATIDEATALANIAAALALTDFSGTLGDLAFENLIEASKLGTTIIEGGYIKSVLLDVNAIRVQGGYALASDTAAALQAAANALQAANAAEQAAEQANIIIEGISSDSVLSAVEKPAILKEWNAIQSERPIIVLQAEKYDLDYTDYQDAFNALNLYIDPLVSDVESNSVIDGPFFRLQFKNYYDAKVTLLKAVSDEAKDLSDAAMAEALAAAQAATGAQNAVDALIGDLGDLAFENAVTLAKLDNTIIQGGYIKTTLIDVAAIRVEGDFATTTTVADAIAGQNLGDLAFEDLIGIAKLDSTIIVGGYIKTSLIDVDVLQAQIVTADYITTLGLVASNIKTNNTTGKRLEIIDSENNLIIYRTDNKKVVELDDDSAQEAPYTVSETPPTIDGNGNPQKDFYRSYIEGGVTKYQYATMGPGVAIGVASGDAGGYTMMGRGNLSMFTNNAFSGISIKPIVPSTLYRDTLITAYGLYINEIIADKANLANIFVAGETKVQRPDGELFDGTGKTGEIQYKNHAGTNSTFRVWRGIIID